MSNMIKGLVVTFRKDIKDTEAVKISDAIRLFDGVIRVDSSVVNANDHINRMQIRTELGQKVFEVFYGKEP